MKKNWIWCQVQLARLRWNLWFYESLLMAAHHYGERYAAIRKSLNQ